jgi:hypothetical protein
MYEKRQNTYISNNMYLLVSWKVLYTNDRFQYHDASGYANLTEVGYRDIDVAILWAWKGLVYGHGGR